MHYAANLSSSSKNLEFEEVYLGLEEETGNFYKGCCVVWSQLQQRILQLDTGFMWYVCISCPLETVRPEPHQMRIHPQWWCTNGLKQRRWANKYIKAWSILRYLGIVTAEPLTGNWRSYWCLAINLGNELGPDRSQKQASSHPKLQRLLVPSRRTDFNTHSSCLSNSEIFALTTPLFKSANISPGYWLQHLTIYSVGSKHQRKGILLGFQWTTEMNVKLWSFCHPWPSNWRCGEIWRQKCVCIPVAFGFCQMTILHLATELTHTDTHTHIGRQKMWREPRKLRNGKINH